MTLFKLFGVITSKPATSHYQSISAGEDNYYFMKTLPDRLNCLRVSDFDLASYT